MKYCTKCGTQMGDSQRFCSNCGADYGNNKPAAVPYGNFTGDLQQPNSSDIYTDRTNRTTKSVIIAVILVLIIAAAVVFLRGRSLNSVVKAYINARIDGDAYKVASLIPDELIEKTINDWYLGSENRLVDEFLEDNVVNLSEDIMYAADDTRSRISYEITDIEDFSSRRLAVLQSKWDKRGVNIKDGKTVTVRTNIKDSSKYFKFEFDVVKIGNSWYLWKDWVDLE